jgi:preprotein translocase subunit SecG
MSFIAGVLTFLLVIDCLVLIFLILMQLPKKDAGAGMAFGGAAADALFGAGSGNFLTQATRYATIALFVMSLGLGYLENRLYNERGGSQFLQAVQQKQSQTTLPPAAPSDSQAAMTTNGLLPPPVTPPTSTPGAPGNAPTAPTNSK